MRRLVVAGSFGLLLGGCAAVAIPALAGGAIIKDRIDGKPDPDAHPERIPIDYRAPPGTPMPQTAPVAVSRPTAGPALVQATEPAPESPQQQIANEAETGPGFGAIKPVKIAKATEQPDPAPLLSAPPPEARLSEESAAATIPAVSPASTLSQIPAPVLAEGDPYAAFVGYALNLAPPPPPGTARRSAMVDQKTITDKPGLSECDNDPPAVLIDLDPGTANFDPTDPPLPAPGLAERLAELRTGGLTVLWTASVRVERAQEVWTVLRATGLDPDRTDRLVLPRKANERKQTRRLAAALDWCIVAIAGDRRGDFDELFDYLRDPDGPLAQALAPAIGRGWFLVPTPIE